MIIKLLYLVSCVILATLVLILMISNQGLKQENEELRWKNWGLRKQIEVLEAKEFLSDTTNYLDIDLIMIDTMSEINTWEVIKER